MSEDEEGGEGQGHRGSQFAAKFGVLSIEKCLCWHRFSNTPVGYGASLLLSIRKIGKWPALLGNRSGRW
jgi:hypothetical protein